MFRGGFIGLRGVFATLGMFAQRTRIPTSGRSIGFCAIWVCMSSSSSSLPALYTHHPIYDFDLRATHARTLLPAALASVSFGFVMIRVRVRETVHEIILKPDLSRFCVCFCIEERTPLFSLLGTPRQEPPLLLWCHFGVKTFSKENDFPHVN